MGTDNMDSPLLKIALPYVVESLTYIYNLCIEQNSFPPALKTAKVIPLPKTKDISDFNNFRSIFLLSILSKPLERHIHKHLTQFIEDRHLFHPSQSGFRQRHSCHTALIRAFDSWLTAINQAQLTGAVFLDFKRAFDLVNHIILLKKLSIYLQNSSTVSLFKSYLQDRTQPVFLNGYFSTEGVVKCGMPQGSVLGPLLFKSKQNCLQLRCVNRTVVSQSTREGATWGKVSFGTLVELSICKTSLKRTVITAADGSRTAIKAQAVFGQLLW